MKGVFRGGRLEQRSLDQTPQPSAMGPAVTLQEDFGQSTSKLKSAGSCGSLHHQFLAEDKRADENGARTRVE